MGFSADRRSGRLGFSGPVELCIVVLVEEGTATTVVLVEFKRSLKLVLGDLDCITLLTMLQNKNAVRGSSSRSAEGGSRNGCSERASGAFLSF